MGTINQLNRELFNVRPLDARCGIMLPVNWEESPKFPVCSIAICAVGNCQDSGGINGHVASIRSCECCICLGSWNSFTEFHLEERSPLVDVRSRLQYVFFRDIMIYLNSNESICSRGQAVLHV
ncbi:hypothetical protein PM082_024074 [Marasmius tenuissimus]|nr:hypothetical protein PM082_024074 [Marasmius tenuissimus]